MTAMTFLLWLVSENSRMTPALPHIHLLVVVHHDNDICCYVLIFNFWSWTDDQECCWIYVYHSVCHCATQSALWAQMQQNNARHSESET